MLRTSILESYTNVMTVLMNIIQNETLKGMKNKSIWESDTNVMSVLMNIIQKKALKCTRKTSIWESDMGAMLAPFKPILKPFLRFTTGEYIWGSNKSAIFAAVSFQICENIWEHTLEKSPTNASNVTKHCYKNCHSHTPPPLVALLDFEILKSQFEYGGFHRSWNKLQLKNTEKVVNKRKSQWLT